MFLKQEKFELCVVYMMRKVFLRTSLSLVRHRLLNVFLGLVGWFVFITARAWLVPFLPLRLCCFLEVGESFHKNGLYIRNATDQKWVPPFVKKDKKFCDDGEDN